MPAPPPPPPTPPLGVIGDRYELLDVVGSGGMGKVFRARDRVLDRIVAVKVIREDVVDDDFLRRFEREAAILARVRSPHIVVVFDYGSSNGQFYLVTDFLPDGDLAGLLARRGTLAPREAADILVGLSQGLADAHGHGVIHRDIKPGNVLLWRRGADLRPVLADFGIAVTADLGLTATGGVIGSPPFMSPERHLGRPATEATDIYAMGCLAFNLLAGAPPYQGTAFQVANAHINDPVPLLPPTLPRAADWDAVIGRCMAKDPAQRYSSAAELGAAFEALGRPVPPPPPTLPSRRGRRALLAVAALVLLVTGVGATWWLGRDTDEPHAEPPAATSDGPQAPGKVDATATSGIKAVKIAVRLPIPDEGTSVVLQRKDGAGRWQESPSALQVATRTSGEPACATLRLVVVADQDRLAGPESEVCGRAADPDIRLVKSPGAGACRYPLDDAPAGAAPVPCTWFNVVMTGFEPNQIVTVELAWLKDGEVVGRESKTAEKQLVVEPDGSVTRGEHAAPPGEFLELCPDGHCDGGFAVPTVVPEVEVRVYDASGKLLRKERAPAVGS